jgi:hypothetical protein
MFARCVLLLSTLLASPASSLKLASFTESQDPCPFGYGKGCNGVDPNPASMETITDSDSNKGKLDAGTRDKVANILEGILTKLSSHKDKDLVQVTQGIAKVVVSDNADDQATGMTSKVAEVLKGYLDKLQGAGQVASREAFARMLADASPSDVGCTYFGACGVSGDHPIDAETKDQVAKLLEGILGNLQSQRNL